FQQPPPELREYIDTAAAGDRPLPELLDLVDYSASKLDHYVADPGALRTNVAVHRTFLDRITAEPLTVPWPPEPSGTLRYRLRELASVTRTLGDDALESRLRTLRRLVRDPAFDRIREVAVVAEELDESTYERVVSGAILEDYEAIDAAIDRLETTLEETASVENATPN
ncbi:MAG: DUF7118 family protein, partial [Halobacteriota archaeon]